MAQTGGFSAYQREADRRTAEATRSLRQVFEEKAAADKKTASSINEEVINTGKSWQKK